MPCFFPESSFHAFCTRHHPLLACYASNVGCLMGVTPTIISIDSVQQEDAFMNRRVQLASSSYETIPRRSLSKTLTRCPSVCWILKRRAYPTTAARARTHDCASHWTGSSGQLPPDVKIDLPTQGQSAVAGTQLQETLDPEKQPSSGLDYLSELLAIQQNGPKDVGFFGTRNMGVTHQKLVEILSYALVLTVLAASTRDAWLIVVWYKGNHIYTSGAIGTNAAVIRGALRAEKQDKLTVVLPQSIHKQPQESQELLKQVKHVIEMPWNDDLGLFDASKLCNQDILTKVQQVICFVFHDSRLMLETCDEARNLRKIVTLFYLD